MLQFFLKKYLRALQNKKLFIDTIVDIKQNLHAFSISIYSSKKNGSVHVHVTSKKCVALIFTSKKVVALVFILKNLRGINKKKQYKPNWFFYGNYVLYEWLRMKK